MIRNYAEQLHCRPLTAFMTEETRVDGYDAAALVRGDQAQALFALLKAAYPEGLSNNELSRRSGIRINAVCARIMELRRVELDGGVLLLEPFTKRQDEQTGIANVVWRVSPSFFEKSRKVVI